MFKPCLGAVDHAFLFRGLDGSPLATGHSAVVNWCCSRCARIDPAMPSKKAIKKIMEARQREYTVRVCRISVLGRIVLTSLSSLFFVVLLCLPEIELWLRVVGLILLGLIPLSVTFAWVSQIGKTAVRMDESGLYVWDDCISWESIVSAELRSRPKRPSYILLSLSNDKTYTIDDGAFTADISEIHYQICLRLSKRD